MILKQLYLDIDRSEIRKGVIDNDLRYRLYLRSRHICNHLERKVLKAHKITTLNFNRIVFTLKISSPPLPPYVNSEKALICDLHFNQKKYLEIKTKKNISSFLSGIILKGLNSLAEEIPSSSLKSFHESIEDFATDDFTSKWIILKKNIKSKNTVIIVYGVLNIDSFTSILSISNTKTQLEENIKMFSCDPDEVLFSPKVRKINIEESHVSILDKFGDLTYTFDLSKLGIN